LAKATDTVLCFGNLPPLFKVKGRVVVFLQNRYLIDKVSLEGFSFVARMRILVERLWLGWCVMHADKVLVQTPSMQQAAQRALRRAVDVVSLCPSSCDYHRSGVGKNRLHAMTYDFLYIATGEPHKNHVNLIEAWKLLAAEGLHPSLCLTVPDRQSPHLDRIIDRARTEHGVRIHNVNAHSWPEMERLYEESGALIYPSTLESFGLPLIEARRAGLSIIAAELDYVRDLVDPEQSFDPRSPLSIARAVKRYLNAPERPLAVVTSESFVQQLLFV
jgi:glycosyltransferase involved in cell wall biosynthesis